MADFPEVRYHGPTITCQSRESLGTVVGSNAAGTGTAWSAANRALYTPFSIWSPFLVAKIFWANGGTASGNLDVAIYTNDGTKIASLGSTAQSGLTQIQSATMSILLEPGAYYMAMSMDNTTGTIVRVAPGINLQNTGGMAQQATAFPLPATATMVRAAVNFVPLMGITTSSVI